MKYLLLFPLLLLLMSCNQKSPVNNEKGTIYYYSEFDRMDRMKLYDGGKTLLTCMLENNQPDTVKKTKQNGKNLYIIFNKPELLKEGAVFKFPNPDIEILIAEWQGKDSFNLNPNIQGTVEVKSHKRYETTVLEIDLKLRTGLSDYKSYQFSKTFSCIKHYKRFKGELPAADSIDIGFNPQNFSAADLDGKWEKTTELFLDKESGRWMEFFFVKEKALWDIKDGKLISPKVQDFNVENGRIMMKDSSGSKLFIINSFRNDSLLITNPLSQERSRYLFVRKD